MSLAIVKSTGVPLPAPTPKQAAGFTQPTPKLIVPTVYRQKET